jgi:hypothetical protein
MPLIIWDERTWRNQRALYGLFGDMFVACEIAISLDSKEPT